MVTMRRNNLIVSRIYHLALCHFPLILREASLLNIEHKKNFKKIAYWYKKANYIVANSDMTKKDFIEKINLDDNKIIRIYNPLIIPRSIIKNKKDNILILGCGRLVSGKNFSELIQVMKLIEADIPNAELVIIGDGEDRCNLEHKIAELTLKEKVSLPGLVTNPYDYYLQADVFVQTSLYEGFGYVLPEAMACGTPVVAYDALGAMREILDNGKYGILVEPHNIEALKNAIITQIRNPTPAHILKDAVARFDKDKIVWEYLQLFEKSLLE
jgi:glycosyltransferase involved in cell wall biosynthesis